MGRYLSYRISDADDGIRVEQYLKYKGYSKHNLAELKKFSESVMVNGQNCHMNERIHVNDELKVELREEPKIQTIMPVELKLSIVFEDEDILVVNKPAGMPIHPSKSHDRDTLANAVMYYYSKGAGSQKLYGEPFIFRCGNRLDQDTSGLTVIAKNMLASAVLSSMVKQGKMRREYLGIIRGSICPLSGTIEAPLGRKPGAIIERVVDWENGESAVTHYQSVKEKNGHSLISLVLETGRTHQIRIHMKYIGAPLIGDYLYNPDFEQIGRQALHCGRLVFAHPVTGECLEFEASLPDDMKRIFD